MSLKIRYLLVLCLAVPVSLLSVAQMGASVREFPAVGYDGLPLTVGGFRGKDLPLDAKTIDVLETEDVLFRVYKEGVEPPVFLCTVFSDQTRRAIHPPEVCYRGGGWEVISRKEISLFPDKKGKAVRLVIQSGGEQRLVYYWYMIGGTWTVSFYRQQWEMALQRLLGTYSFGALVRLSTVVDEISESEDRLKRFSGNLFPLLEALAKDPLKPMVDSSGRKE